MNLFILWTILASVGMAAVIIPLVIKSIKRRRKPKPRQITEPDHNFTPEDVSHPQIMLKSEDRQLYDKFVGMYDSGNLEFNDTQFRKGAAITCEFGISNGFKYINGKMEWGYVRLHTGVDRAGGQAYTFKNGSTIEDPVICPFHFNRSQIIDYGDTGYGALIQLFNDEFGFEMRIGHMNPQTDFIPWSLNRLQQGLNFEPGWVLGKAGTYGDSSGAHTHTEFLSIDDSCEVFDLILEEKFGEKALKEFTSSEVVRLYKKQHHFKDASNDVILKDWAAVKNYRGALFTNKYKYQFGRYGSPVVRTRYSSNLLFNGL